MKHIEIVRHLSYEELEDLYRQTKDARLATRYLAILKLYERKSCYEVGFAVHRSHQVVSNWARRWNEGGPEGLKDQPRSGRPPKLTPAQQAELAEHVSQHPAEGGHEFTTWYLKNIKGYIAEKYGQDFSLGGIAQWRQRRDLVYRVPRTMPATGDPKKTPRTK